MKLEIEVKRIRFSTTQGQAAVCVNGEEVVRFADKIEIVRHGHPYYSEKIGVWASSVPDSEFIKGLLWHPLENMYHYSDRVKKILDADTERMEKADWNVELTDGIRQEIELRPGFKEFIDYSVLRHTLMDWGEVDPEEAEHNDSNPQAAISAYTFLNEIKVYIKAENGRLRAFLPEES